MKVFITLISCLLPLLLIGCEGFTAPVDENPSAKAAEPAPEPEQPQFAEPEEPKDDKGIIGKMTAEVVDAQKVFAENPNLVIVERRGLGNNPLTQGANAYVMLRSQASTFSMQNELKIFRALNERWPTYEEFTDMMKSTGMKFAMLYRWQKYAYDSETGTIMIVSDEALKKKIYDEAGLDYENAGLK